MTEMALHDKLARDRIISVISKLPESVKNFVLLSCNLSLLTEDGI